MTSNVQIANLALVSMHESPITSLDDPTNRALVMSTFFDHVRDAVLESFPWNFAVRRSGSLARLAAAPKWGFQYAYALPTDPKCLRVLKTDRDQYGATWAQENNTLVTDEDEVKILYISQVTDPGQFSPAFVMLFAARLAAETSYAITQNRAVESEMWAKYELKEADAYSNQSQESGEIDEHDSDYLIERR